MNAYIVRPELQKFQRRAWAAYAKRKEYIEAMFGIVYNGAVMVTMFYPFEHTADAGSCSFDDPRFIEYTLDDLSEIAAESGLQLIGTIHSHPGLNTCRHLSNQDVRHIQANPHHELLTGTLHLFVNKRRKYAQTHFSSLYEPVEVNFITSKGKLRKR